MSAVQQFSTLPSRRRLATCMDPSLLSFSILTMALKQSSWLLESSPAKFSKKLFSTWVRVWFPDVRRVKCPWYNSSDTKPRHAARTYPASASSKWASFKGTPKNSTGVFCKEKGWGTVAFWINPLLEAYKIQRFIIPWPRFLESRLNYPSISVKSTINFIIPWITTRGLKSSSWKRNKPTIN